MVRPRQETLQRVLHWWVPFPPVARGTGAYRTYMFGRGRERELGVSEALFWEVEC